jgi:two-component system response regulator HydG
MVQASEGTLFLDEIGEMPIALQPKLLRALQERVVRPVGGDQQIAFDTRLVCATNADLDKAVAEGRFREDLFFRVNVVRIELPPLRKRGQDILLLAQQFLEQQSRKSGKEVVGLTAAAAEKLMLYSWPGNVRELQNCMERAVALTQHDHIKVTDLPKEISEAEMGDPEPELAHAGGDQRVPTLEEIERRHIVKVLNIAEGNKTQAARMLGLDRKTLYRRLKRYGLDGAA